ncbi:girdin-like [Simochromis diagramma]|uniref:girdin-like n=1 Tax=Simochromis diagramma TaxID=43689 RepID=UPI001A7EBED0|nr:girdin-like [Simochromis diagramma]
MSQRKHSKKRQPNGDNINKDWKIMFNQVQKQILNLMTQNKRKCAELRQMSHLLKEKEAINRELYWKLEFNNLEMEELNNLKYKYSEILKKNAKLWGQNKNLNYEYSEILKKNTELKGQNKNLNYEYSEILKKNIELKGQNKNLNYEYSEILKKSTEVEELNNILKYKNDEILRKNSELKGQNKNLNYKYSEVLKKNTELEGQNKNLNYKYSEVLKKNTELEGQNKNLNYKYSEVLKKNTELEGQNKNLNYKYSEVLKKSTELEELHNNLKSKNKKMLKEQHVLGGFGQGPSVNLGEKSEHCACCPNSCTQQLNHEGPKDAPVPEPTKDSTKECDACEAEPSAPCNDVTVEAPLSEEQLLVKELIKAVITHASREANVSPSDEIQQGLFIALWAQLKEETLNIKKKRIKSLEKAIFKDITKELGITPNLVIIALAVASPYQQVVISIFKDHLFRKKRNRLARFFAWCGKTGR